MYVPAPTAPRCNPIVHANGLGWQGVSDNLMDSFAEMLAIPLPPDTETERETDYVTYHLSLLPHAAPADGATRVLDNCVTLRESRRLIASAGATGFRTWEAGLHLGQYLCSNPELIRGKNVLELGTGTGYVSVVCAKYLGAARVVASDGSEDVLNGLSDTAFLNGLQGSQVLIPKELMWGNALVGTEEERWDGGEGVDVVLGADITYDTRAMPALIGTLGELFELYPGVKVIICTTERNVETLRSVLEQCKGAGMETTSVEFPLPRAEEQLGPFYATNVPIHIVEIRRGGV